MKRENNAECDIEVRKWINSEKSFSEPERRTEKCRATPKRVYLRSGTYDRETGKRLDKDTITGLVRPQIKIIEVRELTT